VIQLYLRLTSSQADSYHEDKPASLLVGSHPPNNMNLRRYKYATYPPLLCEEIYGSGFMTKCTAVSLTRGHKFRNHRHARSRNTKGELCTESGPYDDS